MKGQKFDPRNYTKSHDGREGHWLEKQMGITPNADNAPDLYGYEMKKDTGSKTSFGDWSPQIALWKKNKPYSDIKQLNRDDEFLVYFGKPNPKRHGRYSWSGEPAPKIGQYNDFGQILIVDNNDNVLAIYSYTEDKRQNKCSILPKLLQRDDLIVAKWPKEDLKQKLEKKFNRLGFFKCYKNEDGYYDKICFGRPINYNFWISLVRDGVVFHDCGMHQGNKRGYHQWRADNKLWDTLTTDCYS